MSQRHKREGADESMDAQKRRCVHFLTHGAIKAKESFVKTESGHQMHHESPSAEDALLIGTEFTHYQAGKIR